MIKNILHLYALLVCFVTIIILMITFSLSLNFVTHFLIPEYKYHSSLRHYESNDSYIQYYENQYYGNTEEERKAKVISLKHLSPSQLDEKRVSDRRQYLEDKKVETISDLILAFQWILVALIFFFIHWKIYKRSKESDNAS